MSRTESRSRSSGLSALHLGFGAGGLLAIALGAALPGLTGTYLFSILLLPAGTLTCGGVALLQRDRPDSPSVSLGTAIVILGIVALPILALLTAEPFLGLRVEGGRRAFRMPIWSELLILHLGWTVVAIVTTLGLRLIGRRRRLERDLAVGLTLFGLFPLIGLLIYGVHVLGEA